MNTPSSIHLFVPCLVRDVAPEIGRATQAVLARLGLDVVCPPDQTCCGQLLAKQGRADALGPVALHFMERFSQAQYVVAPSASCVAEVRSYPDLFPSGSRERLAAKRLAAKVFELTEFIVEVLGRTDLGADLGPGQFLRAAYHASCQAERVLGVKEPPRALLRAVRGLDLVELSRPWMCCGFGGGFSLAYPEISTAILEEKTADILQTGAEAVIGVEPSCLIHMAGYFRKQAVPVRVLHVAQALAMGLGVAS
jgi:L-lactate dehydrogenase complex protein LldE